MRLDALGPTNLLKKALFQKRVLVEAHEAHRNLGAAQNRPSKKAPKSPKFYLRDGEIEITRHFPRVNAPNRWDTMTEGFAERD